MGHQMPQGGTTSGAGAVAFSLLPPRWTHRADIAATDVARALLESFSLCYIDNHLTMRKLASLSIECDLQKIVLTYKVERYVEASLDSALGSCKRYNFYHCGR